ncbi:MAG TPA: hypothetical protein VKN36_06855 [Eudoraea sp.]|nr:hypothetical protein [Eudoraea sp.]
MKNENPHNHQDRKTLYEYFITGRRPTEEHFRNLIDSTFNKADDGLDIHKDYGLMLYAASMGRIISLFEDKDQDVAKWQIIASREENALRINESFDSEQEDNEEKLERMPPLFLKKGGGLGIRTNDPKHALEVNGIVSSSGRLGNYLQEKVNTVPADGKWHNVFPEPLTGCNAFEIMAYAEGGVTQGKYSLLHATAVAAFGSAASEVTPTCAYYGKWWNRIAIRWESRPSRITTDINAPKLNWFEKFLEKRDQKYNLQIKTLSNYGNGSRIRFNISVLWPTIHPTKTKVEHDNLTLIKGIDANVAEVLIKAGINTYTKLAKLEPEQIKNVLGQENLDMWKFKPDTWPVQAKMAAKNNFETLIKWQQDKASSGV